MMDMSGSTRAKSDLRLLFASSLTALVASDDGSQTLKGRDDESPQAAHGFVAMIIHKKLCAVVPTERNFPISSPNTALVAGDEWPARGYMKGRWPRF